MSQIYMIQETTLTELADLARTLSGSSDLLPVEQIKSMMQQIIDENWVNTNDASAAATDIASGATAYVNGVKVTGTLALQDWTLTMNDGSTVSKEVAVR